MVTSSHIQTMKDKSPIFTLDNIQQNRKQCLYQGRCAHTSWFSSRSCHSHALKDNSQILTVDSIQKTPKRIFSKLVVYMHIHCEVKLMTNMMFSPRAQDLVLQERHETK
jgi:hypothetical protein